MFGPIFITLIHIRVNLLCATVTFREKCCFGATLFLYLAHKI